VNARTTWNIVDYQSNAAVKVVTSVYRHDRDSGNAYQSWIACWAQSGLTAVANQNLVTNIGVGADATHTKRESRMLGLPTHQLGECVHPTTIIRDKMADRFLFEHFISRKPNWVRRVRKTLAIRARAQCLFQWQKPKQVPSP
jgi:hypothetical protein